MYALIIEKGEDVLLSVHDSVSAAKCITKVRSCLVITVNWVTRHECGWEDKIIEIQGMSESDLNSFIVREPVDSYWVCVDLATVPCRVIRVVSN